MTKKPMVMQCGTHGSVEWELHCVCNGCGRVWWINNDPNRAPEVCTCGANLAKDSARAICPSCYKHLYAQQQEGAA